MSSGCAPLAKTKAGRFLPVIYRCYPFAQMRTAHRHVNLGHKRGSVVVRLGDTLA